MADRTNNRSKRDRCEVRLIDGALGGSLQRSVEPVEDVAVDAGDGKVARNGGYLCSGRSMASGGRFYGSLSWYSRGGVLCVERRCSRNGSCGCLAYTNVLEDRGDDIGIFDAGDDAQFAAALGAGLDVDGEDAFQALHPSNGGKGLIRLFELVALGGFTDGGGVERKARLLGEQGGGGRVRAVPGRCARSMPSYRCWARWRVDRGADELIESLTGLEVEVVALFEFSSRRRPRFSSNAL